MKVVPFGPLDAALYRELVRRALDEDLGWGDLTSDAVVPSGVNTTGRILAKSLCVLAGMDVAAEVFRQVDPSTTLTRHRRDGQNCQPGDIVADVAGSGAALVTAERTALNFLQRLSGIATLTRRFVDVGGGGITVLDTRKTTPTLRALEKYAVRAGGGVNHRFALDDGILIKDNHIRLAGGVSAAVRAMRAAERGRPIEVEAQSLEEVDVALESGVDIILVDNMAPDAMRETVRRTRGKAKVEISGSVTLERMAELADTGAEYVSVGALTHSAPAADFSFEIEQVDP